MCSSLRRDITEEEKCVEGQVTFEHEEVFVKWPNLNYNKSGQLCVTNRENGNVVG